jgi:hypothetical protein
MTRRMRTKADYSRAFKFVRLYGLSGLLRYIRIYGLHVTLPEKLDVSFVFADPETTPREVCLQLVGTQSSSTTQVSTVADFRESQRILRDALLCHSKYGVWPISFSYPRKSYAQSSALRSRLVARIIPGTPYSFSDENSYLQEYNMSYYGMTHKKGGWDCFRHLEILNAGAIPLMPDSSDIPQFSMVHYPKDAMAHIFSEFESKIGLPSLDARLSFKEHFNRHLTCEAMAGYIFDVSQIKPSSQILFIDERLERSVDYLSLFTLIGLHQLPDVKVTSMFPTPYLWTDWGGDSAKLYGRGFGYARLLEPNSRKRDFAVSVRKIRKDLRNDRYDAVVFGSIMRNLRAYAHLRPHLDPARTFLMNGEDLPVSSETLEKLTSTGSHVFVRSLG